MSVVHSGPRERGPYIALAFAFTLLLALAPSAFAARGSRTISMNDGAPASIELQEFFENSPRSGWVPLAVRITNRSSSAHTWSLVLQTTEGGDACQLGEWTFPVPPGEQKDFTIFAPLPWQPERGNYFQLTGHFSGPWISGAGQLWFDRRFNGYPETYFTGMSVRLAAENWSRLEAELQGTPPLPLPPGSATHKPAVHLAGTTFEPAEMPADWRSFSGLETIWIHRENWIALTTARRLALLRWVAQGGSLYIAGLGAGMSDLPATPDMRFVGSALWQSGNYGLGTVTRLPFDEETPATTARTSSSSAQRLPIAEMTRLIHNSAATATGIPSDGVSQTTLEIAVGHIRTNGLLLGSVVAVIGILLGPVNLLVLAPSRRRARLFITVPIIAAGGALALFSLILLQDGTGGRGRRAVLVALAPDRPEALVFQEQSVLTGLLIGRSFEVPEDASFNDHSPVEMNNRYGSRGYSYRPLRGGLDRDGTQLGGDWFTSRTIHSHHLREFIPTRASITLENDEQGRPTVVSTCPSTLREVYIVDAERRVWWAGQVPRGQRITLTARKNGMPQSAAPEIQKYFPRLDAGDVARLAGPLTFQATADQWDESVPAPTLSSIRWTDDHIFIVGPVRTKAEVEP